MRPRKETNFLIEVTPEVMDELNRLYMHSDEEPVEELHYSPYWAKQANLLPIEEGKTDATRN